MKCYINTRLRMLICDQMSFNIMSLSDFLRGKLARGVEAVANGDSLSFQHGAEVLAKVEKQSNMLLVQMGDACVFLDYNENLATNVMQCLAQAQCVEWEASTIHAGRDGRGTVYTEYGSNKRTRR